MIQHLGARPETSLKALAAAERASLYEAHSPRFEFFHAAAESHRRPGHAVRSRTARSSPARRPTAPRSSIRAATSRASARRSIELKVTPEKILLTHGHIDHAGGAAELAEALSIPIEGPDERDAFLLSSLEAQGAALRHHRCAQRHADALAGRRRDGQRRRSDVQRAARSRPHAGTSGVRQCAVALRAGRRHAVPGLGRPHRLSLWQSRRS